ncbi:hypothetical protein BC332_27706 [Capsicum chinense]|nr:hypothetical protein BC332_27706 [Capsicum chinense]
MPLLEGGNGSLKRNGIAVVETSDIIDETYDATDENLMQQVGYILQQIKYLVQQISDLLLWLPMDYSSVAMGQLCVASDKIPGATDSAIFMVPTDYSSVATDCKAKHDGVINAINALTASVKEMTSKRGVILSKRISYPNTPLEIKAAKKKRKDTSKASSIIKRSNIAMPLSLSCTDVQCARATEEQHELKKVDVTATAEEHNMTVDNPSTAFKDEKVESVSLGEWKNYPFEGFNISDEASKKLTQLINYYSKWIADGKQNDGRYKVNELSLGFDMFNFVVAHPETKNWFYLMSQLQTCWNDEHIDVIFYYLRNKAKLQTQEQYRYTTGFSISDGLPWHLVDKVYIPINCGDKFHWVLAVVIIKERRIRVYDSMSRRRRSRPFSEIQNLAKILPTYLDMSGFLDQTGLRSFCCRVFERELQAPNDGLDAGLLCKIYAYILWKYGEAKAQKPYATDVKDPRRRKSNSIALDEEQLVHIN